MQSGPSNERRKQSWKDGGVSASRYARVFKDIRKSSRDEDIELHIDFWHGKDGVDVKGNNLPDEIWVEFKNVQGKPGWLYGGATIIAFDIPEEGGFSIVDREELAFFCEKHVKDESVSNKKDAYLKKYTRKVRQDVITIIKLHDIKSLLSYRVWEYDQRY